MELNERSKQMLKGVHPDLVRVILRAALNTPDGPEEDSWVITEGPRTLERQKQLFASGASLTMNSRHLKGDAVDLAIWEDRDHDKVVDVDELSWKFPKYKALSEIVLAAAKELNIPVVWGGSWKSIVDGPHFELDRRFYP